MWWYFNTVFPFIIREHGICTSYFFSYYHGLINEHFASMNNSMVWFWGGLIGVLLIVSFVFNKWINQELVETVEPVSVEQSVNQETVNDQSAVVGEPYDMFSDYPSYPSEEKQEISPIIEKQERVLDKKIIYEMPTSDIFLIQ